MRFGERGNKYKLITQEQRVQVVDLILRQKMTIKKAAQIVGIGSSTARMILKKYEHEGKFFKPRRSKKQLEETELDLNEEMEMRKESGRDQCVNE